MEVISRQDKKDPRSIPVGWEVRRLGSLGSFLKGSGVKKNDANSGDIPCIRYGEIYTHHHDYIRSFNSRISSEIASTATRIKKGDLLFAGSGETKDEIGKCVAYLDNQEAFAGGDIVILRLTEANPMFMGYYCNTAPVNAQKASKGQGDAVVHISASALSSIEVILPPAGEQLAIATALSDVDALIAGLEKLIAKKRDIKQAAMQQLLTGQARLPGFSGKWEVKPLAHLADIRSGGTPSTGDAAAWDGEIPWCTPTDITALDGHKYLEATSRRITTHGLNSSSAELIPPGSVIMTSRATIGECAINTCPITTNQGFKNLVPKEVIFGEFLYYLMSTQKQGLISLCAGSTFLEIGKHQLSGYELFVPVDIAEQEAIANVLSDMDVELTSLESRLAKTLAIKQGMMQELLTGRTRLV